MKKLFQLFVLFTAIIIVAILTSCGKSQNSKQNTSSDEVSSASSKSTGSENDTIHLAVMTANIAHETAIIGQEKGIYDKYNLDLDITEFAMGINTVDAVTLSQADIGMIADYAWINRLGSTFENNELKIVARLSCATGEGTKFYLNTNMVKDISDLSGESIGTTTGTVYDYYNAKLIEKYGLTDVDIQGTSAAAETAALYQSGEIAGFFGNGQAGTVAEEVEGTETPISLVDIGVYTNTYWVASASYLSENEDIVGRFLQATKEVYDYIDENKEEAAKIVYEKISVPEETFYATLDEIDRYIDLKQEDIDALNAINKWALEQGNYSTKFDAADYVYPDIIKSVFPEETDLN